MQAVPAPGKSRHQSNGDEIVDFKSTTELPTTRFTAW
jgi:hypothetical protein